MNVIDKLIAFVPPIVVATYNAIAARVRPQSKRQPRGRLHLWDEVAGWQRPAQPVQCLYCLVSKSASNVSDACSGPMLRPRVRTINGMN